MEGGGVKVPLTAPGRTLPPSPPRGSLGAASAAERRRSQRPDGCVRTGGVAVAKPGRRRGARTALRGPAGRSEEPRAAGSSIPRRLPRARSTVGSRSPRGNHHRHLCHRYHRHGQVQRLPELGRGAGGGGGSGPAGGCGLPAAAAAPRVTAEDPLHLPPGCLHRRRSVCRGVSRTGEYRKAASGPGRSGEQRNPPPPTPQPSVGRVEARGEPAAPGPAGSGPPPCGAAGLRPLHGDAPRAVLPLSAPRLRARRGTRRPHGAASRADAGRPERSFRAGDLTWALLAHPLVLFFFLFVLQTAPDGRSSAFHLEINEGREKRDLVFLR